MSWKVEEVAANKAAVDAYLGKGQFDYWKHQKDEAKKLLASFTTTYSRVPVSLLAYIAGEASLDAGAVEATTHDWSWGIEQISAKRRVNRDQLTQISDIQIAAVETLKIENAVLESLLISGVFAALMDNQYRNIQKAAVDALPKIKALETELKKAQRKVTEAKAQAAVNAGITVLMVFFPQVAVLTKVAVAVGQWAMDEALGDKKSTEAKGTASDVTTYSQIGQPLAEEWLETGGKTFAKRAGKALPVAGLYFDHDEVSAALARADVAKKVLDDAVDGLRRVKALLKQHQPAMVRLRLQMEAVGRELKKGKAKASEYRSDYRDLILKHRYSTSGPVAWRYE